jgi:zinc D-Ala-D-Ala carboxypeptidase
MSDINWDDYPNFSRSEFECQCGCGRADMDPEFMHTVQGLRIAVGHSLRVTSGYRCPKHNNNVSSTGLDGPHTTGKAVDFGINRTQAYWLMVHALGAGITGLGFNQKGGKRFLHLDTLTEDEGHFPRPTIWSY